MSNRVVQTAIDNMNAANLEAASNKAAGLIVRIKGLQVNLAAQEKTEAELKAELNKLQTPEITDASILGSPLPATGQNLNQQAIAKAIDALQKGKLGSVQAQSDRLTQGIAQSQADQAVTQTHIDKLVEELGKITPEVVTESDITGA